MLNFSGMESEVLFMRSSAPKLVENVVLTPNFARRFANWRLGLIWPWAGNVTTRKWQFSIGGVWGGAWRYVLGFLVYSKRKVVCGFNEDWCAELQVCDAMIMDMVQW